MVELILLVGGGIGGFVAGFFVVRNNPRYLNVDKMLKKVGDDKKAELKKKLQDAIDKI